MKRPSDGSSSTGKRSSASPLVNGTRWSLDVEIRISSSDGQIGEHGSDATSPGDVVVVPCRDDAVRVASLPIADDRPVMLGR